MSSDPPTVHSVSADRLRDVREQLIDAVLDQAREAPPGEFLRAVTDRELARAVGVSAGTVRRTFARTPGSEQFGRDLIFVAIVERALADLDAAHRENAARWIAAARRYAAGDGMAAVVEAVGDDLGSFIPAGDARIDARERVYRLAMAVADGDDPASREVALLLRHHTEQHRARYHEAYTAVLHALGLRLADGVHLDHLIDVVSAVLSMLADRARVGILVAPDEVVRLFGRAVAGFLRPVGAPGPDHDPLMTLLSPPAASGGDGATPG